MKLSIIVPMYNVQDYVSTCLDSLVNQTFKDYEVIVVDDGCTDGSPAIVEQYITKYPQLIKMVHKANGGLSDARNYGIPYATGEYIGFIDSDDYAEKDYYEKMVSKMEEGNDVVVSNIEYFYEDGTKSWMMKGLSDWSADSVNKKALLSPMFAWNKVYKAKWFKEENLRYPLNSWYEDIPVTTIIFAKSEHIGYVDNTYIHYRQRSGSIMSVTKSERLKEIFGIMSLVRDNFKKLGLDETYHDEIEYLHIEHLRLYGMFRFIRSPLWSELYDMSEEVMNKYYPQWKQNKYLSNLSFKNKNFVKHYSKTNHSLFDHFIK